MDFAWIEIILHRFDKNIDKDTIFIKFWIEMSEKNLGLFKKNNQNLNPFENSKEYKFLDFAWIEIILHRFDKNIDKDTIFIKFWIEMSEKNLGLFKKNNQNLNPFENSKEYKFLDFTWIEIILPRFDKNIDKDTICIKFWNANIGKNLGLI